MGTKQKKRGLVVGKPAPPFSLENHAGGITTLQSALKEGPAMLVFYPGDFTPVCTKQLCDYRDHIADFRDKGVNIFGISHNKPESHRKFVGSHKFPFPLLTDPANLTARAYGCASLFMLGKVSRAVFLVSSNGMLLYCHVEPTILTRRNSDELLQVVTELQTHNLL